MQMKRKKIFSTDAFSGSMDPARDENVKGTRRRSYDRFFSGYKFCEVPKENGKGTRIVRKYEGNLYRQELSERKCKQVRIAYLILFIISIGLFFGGLFLNIASNCCWYVMLCMIVPVGFYIWLAFILMTYLPSGRDLKEHEYLDGASRLVKACRFTVFGIVLMILAVVLMFIIEPESISIMEMIRLGTLVISAAAVWVMAIGENKIRYTSISSKKTD